MDHDVSIWQMVKIGVTFFVCAYVIVAVIFCFQYPQQVQQYLRSQGIEWHVPGATRGPLGRAF